MSKTVSQKRKAEILNETDRKFVLGASLTLALLFVLLYFNYQDSDAAAGSRRVGILVVKRNLVQRKAETKVSWRSIQEAYPVYEKDTIRTGEESEAVLKLDGKFNIDMDENTTIVLDFLETSKKGRVRLGNGSVRFRQSDPKNPKILNLEIVDKGQTFNLSGAGEPLLNRNKPNEKLKVAALNDKVKLTGAGGIEETLTPDSLLVLSGKKLSKQRFAVFPEKPKDGANVPGSGQSIPVSFSWKKAAKAGKAQLEISERRNFSSFVLKKKVAGSSLRHRLKPGSYYWRLLGPPSKDLPGKYSVIRKFRVVSQAAVKTYKPLAKGLFVYRDIEPFVTFSWSESPNADFYLLEVAKDRVFKDILVKKSTSSVSYGDNLKGGQYYWRVTVKNRLTASRLTSSVKSFKVVQRKEAKLNVKLNLAPNQVLDKKVLAKKGFVLNWVDSPEIATTEVIVSEDPNFSDVVMKKKVGRNFFRIQGKLTKKVYYYKLKSYNEQGELISDPPVRKFRVENTKIKIGDFRLVRPKNNSSLHKGDVLKKGIAFVWAIPTGEDDFKYKFLLAKDRAFKKVILKKDMKNRKFTSTEIKKNGTYYWKVKVIDASDNSQVTEIKPQFFSVVQLPLIGISGIGTVRGRIVSRGAGGSVKISTSQGLVSTSIDKITSVQHDY